jgi:hypothetical protein
VNYIYILTKPTLFCADCVFHCCASVPLGKESWQTAETVRRNKALSTWQRSTNHIRHSESVEVPEGVHQRNHEVSYVTILYFTSNSKGLEHRTANPAEGSMFLYFISRLNFGSNHIRFELLQDFIEIKSLDHEIHKEVYVTHTVHILTFMYQPTNALNEIQ